MKTLSQILELYKPKSQDEDKFVKKHIVVKHRDRNGNGDPVFQATNIKAVGREKERHGYEPGKDEEVYEEYEDIQESGEIPTPFSSAKQVLALGNDTREKLASAHDAQKKQHNRAYNKLWDTGNHEGKAGREHQDSAHMHSVLANMYRDPEDHFENEKRKKAEGVYSGSGVTVHEEYEDLEENQDVGDYDGGRGGGSNPPKGGYKELTPTEKAAQRAKDKIWQDDLNKKRKRSDAARAKRKAMKTAVKEETEQLDEIGDTSRGQEILARVRDRALKRREDSKAKISDLQDKQDAIADVHGEKAARNMPQHKELGSQIEREFKKSDRYHDTYDAAKARIDPARRSAMGLSKIKQNEQVEHLEEKLKVSDGIGAWISDFVHSKNPKFDGFSKRKRMKMAQAAFYSAQEGD